jgi:hypothetical protein
MFFSISDVFDVNGQRHCLSILPIKIELNSILLIIQITPSVFIDFPLDKLGMYETITDLYVWRAERYLLSTLL